METESVFFGIDDYMAIYSGYIKRAEARELAQCYVVGLMMDGCYRRTKTDPPLPGNGPGQKLLILKIDRG